MKQDEERTPVQQSDSTTIEKMLRLHDEQETIERVDRAAYRRFVYNNGTWRKIGSGKNIIWSTDTWGILNKRVL